jgi:hypothetical protein
MISYGLSFDKLVFAVLFPQLKRMKDTNDRIIIELNDFILYYFNKLKILLPNKKDPQKAFDFRKETVEKDYFKDGIFSTILNKKHQSHYLTDNHVCPNNKSQNSRPDVILFFHCLSILDDIYNSFISMLKWLT